MTDKEYFYGTYKEAAIAFQSSIGTRLDTMLTTFPDEDPMRVETLRFVRDGGKRLRTVLGKLVTQFYHADDAGASAALDTFHKFLLCHDDIIDRDAMRWGMPTVHTALESVIKNEKDKVHGGNALATISGDLISAMAYRLILESTLSNAVKIELMTLICQCMDEVAWGWYDQFLMDYERLDSPSLSYERIRNSVIWVTGKYTISFPLRFGYAILQTEMDPRLEEIADHLGVLFQTGDDLIGIFGDSEKSGKSNYGDIVQGKKTLPLWFAYERATEEQKQVLVQLVGKKDITAEEVDRVKTIITSSGAYEYTREYMHTLCIKIHSMLNPIDIPSDMKRFLNGFADYLVDREA